MIYLKCFQKLIDLFLYLCYYIITERETKQPIEGKKICFKKWFGI